MYFSKVIPIIFAALRLASTSLPCPDVTHSECVDDDSHIYLETDAPNKEACQQICALIGENCHFSLFDKNPHFRGNCRLYDSSFSRFILGCNELSGPKYLRDDCNLEKPEDNTCQIYRQGKCDFGVVEETEDISSWESCDLLCQSISQCQLWRFEKEERKCKIIYSGESSCTWQFSPREPSFDKCEQCDIPKPPNHGDWFCPPSSDPFTCHLECDPGYTSNNKTVITCNNGEWSSSPSCVEAVALITGDLNLLGNTVEIYSEQLHKKLPNLPDERNAHSLDVVNSLVLLCGGGRTTVTSCLALTSSQHWTHHSDTIMRRAAHSSVSMLGQVHLLGGSMWIHGHSSPSSTEYLAPPSELWHQSWDLLQDTAHACSTKIGHEVFITTGGVNPSSVVSYNMMSGSATRLQDLITEREQHGCVYLKEPTTGSGRVLVAGGANMVSLSSSEMYDIATGEWAATGELTTSRYGMRMVALGDSVLAMGGMDAEGIYLSSVDRFNWTSMLWTATENMLQERYYHAVTGVPPSAVRIGHK